MILEQCPHCGVAHVNTAHAWHAGQGGESAVAWYVEKCQNPECQKFVLVIMEGEKVSGTYPTGRYELGAKLEVSKEIRDEYREAGTCLGAGCCLASMTMSRRVLQRCLKHQGFEQRTLNEQINAAKNDATIPRRYHALADEIREYGNIGAHPDDDNLELVTPENAMQLLKFTELLIQEFYELPDQAESLRRQRKGS
ncbi:MAG: DUF4145 domain-containing protein [Planctomycetes bacterium]|nr:DUF4145 domain-containing protein [Planctomycetota bacterium]